MISLTLFLKWRPTIPLPAKRSQNVNFDKSLPTTFLIVFSRNGISFFFEPRYFKVRDSVRASVYFYCISGKMPLRTKNEEVNQRHIKAQNNYYKMVLRCQSRKNSTPRHLKCRGGWESKIEKNGDFEGVLLRTLSGANLLFR